MAGVDYRQIQASEQVRTDLPDSGAAQRAAELHKVFSEFEGASQRGLDTIATQAGAIAGAASGNTGHPDYKTGLLRFTAYSRAFNNAATGAYAIQAEAQADDAAARLRVEANNNPSTFATTYSAVRDSVVKAAPPQAQAELARIYNQRLAAGLGSISYAQAEEIKVKHQQEYDVGIERGITRTAILQGSEDPHDQLEGLDEFAKLTVVIHGGANAGLYSPAVAEAKLINAHKEVSSQIFQTQLDRDLRRMRQTGDSGDVIKLMDDFRDRHLANPVFSEPEFNKIYSEARQKILQERQEDMLAKQGQKTAEQLRYEAGARKITVAMANNTPGPVLQKMVADMVGSDDLHDPVGRAVLGSIQRGTDAPPDYKAMFYAENNPGRFDWTADDIANLQGLSYKQKIELTQKIESQRQGWEGHAAIKDARAVLNAALKLPSGIALETATDEQKKAAADSQVELTKQLSALNLTERDA